jgi:glucose/arabinose dehydrogenase
MRIIVASLIVLALSACTAEQPPMPRTPRPTATLNPEATYATRVAPPPGSAFRWRVIADGFDNPLLVTHAGDRSRRLFVVEQAGLIWIVQDNGDMLPEPFLDIFPILSDETIKGGYTERGLLGLAFSPNYAENGQFYITYSNQNGDTVLARYRVSADDANRAELNSGEILLTLPQPFWDHKAGHIAFGHDGYLYIALGDGGSQGDPLNHVQDLSTFFGKILRLDVESGEKTGDKPYAIPPDNPFVNTPNAAPEVWALGLRNPWRFSFDRITGDLYIADVGWAQREEVNFAPASSKGGENYGWSTWEGTVRIPDKPELTDPIPPIYEYDHGLGCSVTGGYVYRGNAIPSLRGVYIFGDYCNGRVWRTYRDSDGTWKTAEMMVTERQISSFGEDELGEMVMVDYKGAILRLEAR